MAKVTKKQDNLFTRLVPLFHNLIMAKHSNNRDYFNEVIAQIYAEVDVYVNPEE